MARSSKIYFGTVIAAAVLTAAYIMALQTEDIDSVLCEGRIVRKIIWKQTHEREQEIALF